MNIKNFLSLVLSVALLCLFLPMDFMSSLSVSASYNETVSFSAEPATTYTTTVAPDSETTVTPVEPDVTTTAPVTTTTTVTTTTVTETTVTTAVTTTSSEESYTTTTTSTSDEPDPSYTTTTTTSTTTTTTMTTSTTKWTTTTTTSTSTTTTTSTSTTTHTTLTTTPPLPNLILQCSVSCSDNPGELVMSGKTQGVERMDSLGFRNVRILRSTDLKNWYEEFYIGNISMRNSLVCMVDGYTVSVQGGAYYRISCEHYARLDNTTQFVENLSDYVWVDGAPIIITSTTTATNVTTKTTRTTASSVNNSTNSGNSGSSVNVTDSPKTDASMPSAPFVVLLCAFCSALILRRRVNN
ncbi:MAG: hypothetical protein IJO99_02690 [Ruminococcus sp.]|nr:hypothetical protein [Ruminococcus sp.]